MPGVDHPARLEKLVEEAAFKLKRSEEYRASAASLIAECRRRVDAGDPEARGAAWADYCRIQFSRQPYIHVGKLLLGSSGAGRLDREQMADSQDAFARAWAEFVALDRKDQSGLLTCGAALLFQHASGTSAAGPVRLVDQLA